MTNPICLRCRAEILNGARYCSQCGLVVQPDKSTSVGESTIQPIHAVERFNIFAADISEILSKLPAHEHESVLVGGKLSEATDFAAIVVGLFPIPLYYKKVTVYIIITDIRIVFGVMNLCGEYTLIDDVAYEAVREMNCTIRRKKWIYISNHDRLSVIRFQFVNGNDATIKSPDHDLVRAVSKAASRFVVVNVQE